MAPDPPAERRSSARVTVALELQLARRIGSSLTVRTLDISATGARVLCARPLRIYEELTFDGELPPRGQHIEGTARVLRQHRPNVYALRFEHIATDVQRELEAFVEAGAGTWAR
jgi:c-di-GMP-binding flagellar brake protein YcgR